MANKYNDFKMFNQIILTECGYSEGKKLFTIDCNNKEKSHIDCEYMQKLTKLDFGYELIGREGQQIKPCFDCDPKFNIDEDVDVLKTINDCECGTTTSTTTFSVSIPECCSTLFEVGDQIIYLDQSNNQYNLDIPEYTPNNPMGVNPIKLWSIGTSIKEWDIVLNPFNAYYNRNIILPASFSTSVNFAAKNNTTLIVANDFTPTIDIVELDIIFSLY
jgi:hypothetical protein